MTNLAWLQQWYLPNCNGEWEHQGGIYVNTIDNPGWSVKINLRGTRWEHLKTSPVVREASETDWVHYSIGNHEFNGVGGPENLEELVQIFRDLVKEAVK